MRATSWLLAACGAALAGALGGKALDTDPVSNRADVLADIPRHEIAVPLVDGTPRSKPLPDHYALETPEGRVEVAELAMHGRFRDKLAVPVYTYPGFADPAVEFRAIEPNFFEYAPSRARFERPEHLAAAPAEPEQFAPEGSKLASAREAAAEAVEVAQLAAIEASSEPLPNPSDTSAEDEAGGRNAGGPKTIDVAAALAARP